DGIRDFHVTGVQTCALPISWMISYLVTMRFSPLQGSLMVNYCAGYSSKVPSVSPTPWSCGRNQERFALSTADIVLKRSRILSSRSEERRVGNEYRHERSSEE